ncbi:hypothetical protein BJX64DRAFT_285328 [Aspergillus heterothallicus]
MSAPEPIAIIGLACRLPGGADTPEKLWDLVASGRQCWSEIPASRYNQHAFHHPDPDARATHNARGGHFLDGEIAAFDAPFFGIASAEAAAMDPQQRLLLEVSYEALENAGLGVESIKGSQTGVYVALVSRDYDRQIYKDPAQIPKHHLTGCGDATACGRISYVFDLKGPCMALDTGCSGGMIALHLACQALRAGEANTAIVGGTNLLLGPDMTIAMSALHMINDNGRCYPFDNRGAGYGRAEGVAALVVKRLSAALRDGDPIRAVIRNTGANQDGKTNGILLPSAESQAQLSASLYQQAGLNPHDVGYIEAHGTGTQAGDLAEVTSIKSVFDASTGQKEHPLFLGSIKANIGHSESTSGLAGVIKAVLALENAMIPPLAGLETLKPELLPLLEGSKIVIPQKPYPWPHQRTRLASVNSFGFGGSNAHAILQSAPLPYTNCAINGSSGLTDGVHGVSNGRSDLWSTTAVAQGEETPLLFAFSARSKTSLEKTIQNIRDWILANGEAYTKRKALAQTLSHRRSTFKWRSTIAASSYHDLLSAMQKPRTIKATAKPRVAFIFTGQGSQYARMGRSLIHQKNAFSRSLHKSQEILGDLGASWSLIDEILCDDSESRINCSELSQPATTAIQIALVDMLSLLGVQPSAVLGHSSGEVAAAYAAGILDHVEALTIAYHKGFVAGWCKQTDLPKGGMLAVGLGEAETLQYLQRGHCGKCTIACVNSPSSVTLSGDELAITEVQKLLNKDSVFNRRLKVDIAYHSHHMAAVSAKFHNCIHNVSAKPASNSVPFFSSLTGSQVSSPVGASYWVDNLVSQVRFAPALERMTRTHCDSSSEELILVEIGPHSALQGPVRQIMSAAQNSTTRWSYVPTLVRNKDSGMAALEMVGALFEHGVPICPTIDFTQPSTKDNARLPVITNLPPYPWDHSESNRYWHESRLSKDYRLREHPPHDLCGLRLVGTSTIEPVFRHILSVDELPWLQEHIIDGFALYPGSAFLCMGIEALRQVTKDRGEKREITKYYFRDVSFSKALVVPDSPGSVETLMTFRPSRGEWEEFRITSVSNEGIWNEHCRGYIKPEFQATPAGDKDEFDEQTILPSVPGTHLEFLRQNCKESISSDAIYLDMRNNGIDYGETFTIIQNLQLGDHKALGYLQVSDVRRTMPSQHMQPHIIHPATFDAFMHVALPLYHRHCSQGPVMLTSIGEVTISADILKESGDKLLVACDLTQAGRRHGSVDVSIFQSDPEGNVVEVGSLSRQDFRAIGEASTVTKSAPATELPPPCYHLDLVPVSPNSTMAHSSQGTFNQNVSISCLTETPLTLALAKDLRFRLGSSDGGEGFSILSNGPVPGSSSIHVVLIDDLCRQLTTESLVPLLRKHKSVLLVTISSVLTARDAGMALSAVDLARVTQEEVDEASIVTLDYQDTLSSDSTTLCNAVTKVLQLSFTLEPRQDTVDCEYVYRHGHLLVPRLQPNSDANQWLISKVTGEDLVTTASFHQADRTVELQFKTPGLFDSAIFVPCSNTPRELDPDEISVRVYAHGMNAVDVSIALDRADPTETMMGEFAGIVVEVGEQCRDLHKPGDRVCGWGAKPYTNTAVVKRHLVHRLDESIPFSEGASVPVAFVTAMYALDVIAGLEQDQTVLIHGAAGDVGQAAMSIAQHIGSKIYAIVESKEEKQLLVEKAAIAKNRVFSATSTALKSTILDLTAGKGIDVILDCSSAGQTDGSLSLVADFGYMIHIAGSGSLPSEAQKLRRNVTFASVDLQLLAARRPKQVEKLFSKVMELYHSVKLGPLATLETMSLADISSAFRVLHSQRSSRKIVLEVNGTTLVKQIAPGPQSPVLTTDGAYAVVGGSPALNRALCAFLEERGARHIVSVLYSNTASTESDKVAPFQQVVLDETGSLEDLLSALSSPIAPLKGILHVEWTPKEYSLPRMTHGQHDVSMNTRRESTEAVREFAASADVEFCLNLASFTSLLSSERHVSPNLTLASHASTIRLCTIEGVETWGADGNGTASITLDQLYNVLDYSITAAQARTGEIAGDLFTGLTPATCPRTNPIFKAIHDANESADNQAQSSIKRIDQQIASAESMGEVHRIVLDAAVHQLSTFLALDAEDINKDMSIASLGLDSLLAIEFKNWLVRTTQAPVQTSEVLDAPSLLQLVETIMKRSKLVQKSNGVSDGDISVENTNGTPNCVHSSHPTPDTPPPLPIPDLKSLIDRHLSYLRAHATDTEYERTLALATDFQSPGSMGKRLYDRLRAIQAANPDTWYHDLYLRNQYLVRNGPLAPYMTFFFTHPVVKTPHSQAERAALVASTMIRYKARLDHGEIKPRIVNEQPLCMDLYKYLFNTTREPTLGVDKFIQYPGNEYFVVLRRGHVWKVGFSQIDHLERILDQILLETATSEVDWLGVLTTDDRISWAKTRQSIMDQSMDNASYIRTIEQSAFVLSLDDSYPATPEERGRHFHFSDGSNRWYDKPINFIVTANGASGMLGDHTGLDASTVHDLNTEIADAIRQHRPRGHTNGITAKPDLMFERVQHSPITPSVESRIQHLRASYNTATTTREHSYPPPLTYGSSLMQRHKIPPNSAFQLLVQLAGRYYFGYTSPCWETVLQSNFATGRVEINQVVSVQVAAFVEAAISDDIPLRECRKLFVEAARAHSSSVLACTRAGGSDRFLSMLREIVDHENGEEEPGLFHDPVYARARPRKFISNCFATGMAENGCVLRDEEGVWLHFEVEPAGVKFSIVGPTGQTAKFSECLVRAAARVQAIVEAI